MPDEATIRRLAEIAEEQVAAAGAGAPLQPVLERIRAIAAAERLFDDAAPASDHELFAPTPGCARPGAQ